MKTKIRQSGIAAIVVAALGLAGAAHGALRLPAGESGQGARVTLQTVQRDGMSLSEAVESVRRRSNVERVISAETRTRNGREVHYIRVMTKDGKVQTVQVPGRRQN